MTSQSTFHRGLGTLATCLGLLLGVSGAFAQVPAGMNPNEPGILEPVSSSLQAKEIRVPNTDQSIDGVAQSNVHGSIVFEEALETTSLLGHDINHVASPNMDMRMALLAIAEAAEARNTPDMEAAADELMDILMGTTEGRIYDGFSMLNFNRWKDPTGRITAAHFPADAEVGEYKMKVVTDTGERFTSPFDGSERKIWEANVNMLYYDGQIDSDSFLLHFPVDVHPDDTVRVHYRIYSLVEEDFSPTLVMLDRREALNSVNFPFKGFDAVWIAFFPGQVLNVSIDYPPARIMRGVYTWGWRVHPPRIQFLQPTYDIFDRRTCADPSNPSVDTCDVVRDPQSESFIYRNREDLTLDAIGEAAPEMKMFRVAQAILDGATPEEIDAWLNDEAAGPRGIWQVWADLAEEQRQLPDEAWEMLEAEGIRRGTFGDYQMVSVFLNNEMYGEGPFFNEVRTWEQGENFKVKLLNLDNHTHYFRNVDFGARLHDDILRCCGGGETSFEIMNFKPSYGAPKVAEMQWRAGWGFRPHYDVIQQQGVFSRGRDRTRLTPYTGGEGGTYFGYQYSPEHRGGDFRFNPPNFIIGFDADNPSTFRLRDVDGRDGLVIGRFTEGYGIGQVCPDDPYPGFCSFDMGIHNPNGALNFDTDGDGTADELRYPPFLRNPAQGAFGAGDIIPPTGAWRPFLWLHPRNGTLWNDPNDPSQGYWSDVTYSHGATVFAGDTLSANIELPRASGQVFYQFDDLFHDNSIFSPHPVPGSLSAPDEIDELSNLRATLRDGALAVRGEVSELIRGGFAPWVTVYTGALDGASCSGLALGSVPVRSNGRFVFRAVDTGLDSGDSVCIQSVVNAAAALSVD